MTRRAPVPAVVAQAAALTAALLGDHLRRCAGARVEPDPALVALAEALSRLRKVQDGSNLDAVARGVHDGHVGLLLDLDAVAAELAVSKSTAKRLVACGDLPSLLVGGARRVRRSDLEAYVARQAGEGPVSFRDRADTKAALDATAAAPPSCAGAVSSSAAEVRPGADHPDAKEAL